MESNIKKFFKNKTVFLTGGTGFLGKVIIEKLLRTTEVNKIYILIRKKKDGKDINERIQTIFSDVLFEKLHALDAEPAKRVKAIAGDCVLNNLGICEADRQLLIENVNVIIHSAATVRFNEPLSSAVSINVRATVDMIHLAQQMKHLQAFIHVSSAFANCLVFHIEETYYTEYLGTTATEILQKKRSMDDKSFDNLNGELIGDFPNTYCYTKSIAEEAILSMGDHLPICIFRPGIIIPTSVDPIPGWIDNLYGPMSIVYGGAIGVLRVMYGRTSANAGLVPVDFCANMILACAWDINNQNIINKPSQPPIYNLVPDEINSIKWGAYQGFVEEYGRKIPLSGMIWFPYLYFIDKYWLYKLLCLVYHTIPGYIIDFILIAMGKKRRMTKMYAKIHKQCDMLRYFVSNEWTFDMRNTKALWKVMTPYDQTLYNFDMVKFDWSKYAVNSLYGMRKYLAKEEPDTIPKGRKLLRRLYILDTIVHSLVYGTVLWLLWTIIKCTIS